MAENMFNDLSFPKNTDINTLNSHFIVDWKKVEGVGKFLEEINGHPYDEWEPMFTLVPYHNEGTVLLLSSDGKHITVHMPSGHTEFEYKVTQILIDLKSCGYAFAGILQSDGRTTELRELFDCVDQVLQMDEISNSQASRDVVVTSLRKLVSEDSTEGLVAASELAFACAQLARPYQNHFDIVNASTQNMIKFSAGIISGATQLEALMSSIRGKTTFQLGHAGADAWPTQYWLNYAQKMDQALGGLDMSSLDVWQDCWIEMQSNLANVISQAKALGETFAAVDMDHSNGLADLLTSAPLLAVHFQELFDQMDQAMLIVRQFGGSKEKRKRMEDIFRGIDVGQPITSFPINASDQAGAARLRAEFIASQILRPHHSDGFGQSIFGRH